MCIWNIHQARLVLGHKAGLSEFKKIKIKVMFSEWIYQGFWVKDQYEKACEFLCISHEQLEYENLKTTIYTKNLEVFRSSALKMTKPCREKVKKA